MASETASYQKHSFNCHIHNPEKEAHIPTIFDYYSVPNEIQFVKNQLMHGTTPTLVEDYVGNNVLHFLGEFAGHVKDDRISYQLLNGHLYYPGITEPILYEYAKIAELKGGGSREEAEAIGFRKIEKAFAENQADLAFWISPPSFGEPGYGNYGYMFTFVKNRDGLVEVYLPRYEHEDQLYSKSFDLLTKLMPYAQNEQEFIPITSEKDFLKQPLVINTGHPLSAAESALTRLGFEKSKDLNRFMKQTAEDEVVSGWTKDYINIIMTLASVPLNPLDQQLLIVKAKEYLQAIHNYCIEIAKIPPSDKSAIPFTQITVDPNQLQQMFAHYSQKEAVVIGGGSCPITQTGKKSASGLNGLLTYLNIDNKMSSNQTDCGHNGCQENSSHFHCPKCGTPIQSGQGITKCVNSACGITKEEYAREKNGSICD